MAHDVSIPFACPVCESRDSRLITLEQSRRGTVGIRRCRSCGLFFTYPRLDAPQGEYQATTYEGWMQKYGAIERGEIFHDRHQNYLEEVSIVREFAPSGRLLDVGCNAGWLLGYLDEAGGWELEGLEPGPALAAIAQRRVELPIHNGYLHELPVQLHYDALTATDVIEHINPEDIHAFVADIARVLKPGGYVFIKTPNANFTLMKHRLTRAMPAPLRRLMLRAPDVWDAKEHTIHWTAETLASILRQHGLETVRVFVPLMVETSSSPLGARLARRLIYRAAHLLGGGEHVPDFAQDIFIVARKRE